jgi:hypothetical protein
MDRSIIVKRTISAARALPPSALVLFAGDVFHPVNDLSILLFLNCDVGHGRAWRGDAIAYT